MKKFLSILISVFSIGMFVACGETNTSSNSSKENLEDKTFVYNNIKDFSCQQGWRGWKYCYRDAMGEVYKMTFDLDNGRWNGRDFYCYISNGEQHPGNNTETIIGWEASYDGIIQVQGSVKRNPVEMKGDGVFYYITKQLDSEENYLYDVVVEATKAEPYEYTFETEVKAGDSIYFCINGNVNNSYDSTKSDITIQYKQE